MSCHHLGTRTYSTSLCKCYTPRRSVFSDTRTFYSAVPTRVLLSPRAFDLSHHYEIGVVSNVAWPVCLSVPVCWSKTDEPIEVPLGGVDLGGPHEPRVSTRGLSARYTQRYSQGGDSGADSRCRYCSDFHFNTDERAKTCVLLINHGHINVRN